MARPKKDGLEYFPLDIDIFDDDKLFDVQNEYGPLGEVIYLRLLSMIYKNGYYYKYDSLDKLAGILIKSIGNRWARDKQAVIQVIPFLAKCNLFSPELMQENVLTSVGIQKRYLKATERRQPLNNNSPYRLVDENGEPLISVHKNDVNVCNNEVNVCNNSINDVNNTQSKVKKRKVKQSKENKNIEHVCELIIYFPNDEKLDKAFNDFLSMRNKIKKPMTDRAIELAIKKLDKMTLNNNTKIEILEQSIMNSWQDLYPLKDQNNQSKQTASKFKDDMERWVNDYGNS